jgi:hypothetical protein
MVVQKATGLSAGQPLNLMHLPMPGSVMPAGTGHGCVVLGSDGSHVVVDAEGHVLCDPPRDHQPQSSSGDASAESERYPQSGEDLSFRVDLSDALQSHTVASAAIVAAVSFGETGHAIVRIVHG